MGRGVSRVYGSRWDVHGNCCHVLSSPSENVTHRRLAEFGLVCAMSLGPFPALLTKFLRHFGRIVTLAPYAVIV